MRFTHDIEELIHHTLHLLNLGNGVWFTRDGLRAQLQRAGMAVDQVSREDAVRLRDVAADLRDVCSETSTTKRVALLNRLLEEHVGHMRLRPGKGSRMLLMCEPKRDTAVHATLHVPP